MAYLSNVGESVSPLDLSEPEAHNSASPRNSKRSLSTKSSEKLNLDRGTSTFLLEWMKAAWKTCGLSEGRAGGA